MLLVSRTKHGSQAGLSTSFSIIRIHFSDDTMISSSPVRFGMSIPCEACQFHLVIKLKRLASCSVEISKIELSCLITENVPANKPLAAAV